MRELILLLVVLVTVQVHAQEVKKNKLKLMPPGQKAQATEDPGNATRLLYEDPRNKNSLTHGVNLDGTAKGPVTSTCTDNMGMIYKKGDAGYDGCLRTFSHVQPKLPGDDKRQNAVGFTIGN